jgi:hypothetical protein
VLHGKAGDLCAKRVQQGRVRHDDGVHSLLLQSGECLGEVVWPSHGHAADCEPQGSRSMVLLLPPHFGNLWPLDSGNVEPAEESGSRHHLLHKFKPFHRRLELLENEASDVTAWSRQAGDYPARHRIAYRRNYDGDLGGRLLCRARPGRSMSDYDVDLRPNELRGQSRQAVELSLGPAIFDDEVPAFLVSAIPETLSKRSGLPGEV